MNKQFYAYIHTHSYLQNLSVKDRGWQRQHANLLLLKIFPAQTWPKLCQRAVERSRDSEETVRPRTTWKTFPSMQKCRQRISLPWKDTKFIWTQHIKKRDSWMWWSTCQERKGTKMWSLWSKPLYITSSNCHNMNMGSDDLIYAEKIFWFWTVHSFR